MKIKHPKKNNFNTNVSVTMERIRSRIGDQCRCSMFPTSMSLFDIQDWKAVKEIIKDTVKEVFGCKRACKYCKVNRLEGNVYIRFKQVI